MNNDQSIKETLDVIRRALEDENSEEIKTNILLLNKQVNDDGTVKNVENNYIDTQNVNKILEEKINNIFERKIDDWLKKNLNNYIKKHIKNKKYEFFKIF